MRPAWSLRRMRLHAPAAHASSRPHREWGRPAGSVLGVPATPAHASAPSRRVGPTPGALREVRRTRLRAEPCVEKASRANRVRNRARRARPTASLRSSCMRDRRAGPRDRPSRRPERQSSGAGRPCPQGDRRSRARDRHLAREMGDLGRGIVDPWREMGDLGLGIVNPRREMGDPGLGVVDPGGEMGDRGVRIGRPVSELADDRPGIGDPGLAMVVPLRNQRNDRARFSIPPRKTEPPLDSLGAFAAFAAWRLSLGVRGSWPLTSAPELEWSVPKEATPPLQSGAQRHELQLDGLVGPTHNYAGLSPGNVASATHAGEASNPRAAAHQGLAKMRFVRDLGVAQAVLPPHDRPSLAALRRLGFHGTRRRGPRVGGRGRWPRAAPLLERVGDVDRERRDGRAVGRHGGRPRSPRAGEPAADVPPRHRGRDDHARAAGDLRRPRRASSSTIRSPAAGSSPTRARPTTCASRRRAAPRTSSRGDGASWGAFDGPRVAPCAADARGLVGAGAAAPARSGALPLPAAAPGRHRRGRLSHRRPRAWATAAS